MERQDDAEHHEDASGDDPCHGDYPRGRGYGQDYMRGGEVFGGYGYSKRLDYTRPLAAQRPVDGVTPEAAAGSSGPRQSGPDVAGAIEDDDQTTESAGDDEAEERRFPQDARAGQWTQPAPTVLEEPDATTVAVPSVFPRPTIGESYGAEGSRNHSRSYYLTQAQRQYRSDRPPQGP